MFPSTTKIIIAMKFNYIVHYNIHSHLQLASSPGSKISQRPTKEHGTYCLHMCQKSKETRRMEMGSIFVLYIQPTIPTYIICRVASDYSVVMYVIVGWIYRTKIDPISILIPTPVSLLFQAMVIPTIFFHFTEMLFPLQ